MKKGDIINNIYYRDHPIYDYKIQVAFETSNGWFLYHDFELKRIHQPALAAWTLFSKFNSQYSDEQQKRIESVKLDSEMSLLVLLSGGDYIVVYFDSSQIIGINSAQVIDIFLNNEISDGFKYLIETAKDIGPG